MSNPTAPVKTPLGQEELRRRTHGLGQRYRTILLLVDGRRPLAEVLSMAHQAGAQTSHFERLVGLGMVELPRESAPAAPGQPAAAGAEGLEGPAPGAAGETQVPPADGAIPADSGLPGPAAQVAAPQPGAQPAAVGPAPAEPPGVPAPVLPAAPEEAAPGAPEAVSAPEMASADAQKLGEVRRLLLETLRRDTLLHRVFAPARVRSAQTQDELIGLVWEIERERAHARRKRGQLLNLQRARELLGMGNTVVAEDSLPWPPSVQ